MKRTLICLIVLAALVCAAVPAAAQKIGVIDMRQIIEKSEPGIQADKDLRARTKDMETKLKQQEAEIAKLVEELQKQSLALSQTAKQDKELELRRKQRDYQDSVQHYRRVSQQEMGNVLRPIEDVLAEVVKNFGTQNGFTLLMDKSALGIMYNDPAVDVTNQVIVELNKAWRAKK